jgi:hypothetical protein
VLTSRSACNSSLLVLFDMDVDPPASPRSSSSKRSAAFPPASPPPEKRAKILLPHAELIELSAKMPRKMWQILVKEAEADDSLWWEIHSDVLMYLTEALASTSMKHSVIASPNPECAKDIAKSFNEDELEQWKVGVWNGVDRNDWTDLLVHRTYISDYQIIRSHLIVTTAKLRIPKTPNIASMFELSREQEEGTPIRKITPFSSLTGPLSHQVLLGMRVPGPSGGSLMDTHPEPL